MDIYLLNTEDWTHIRPTSVHGMLWLQTHFENDQWDDLAAEKVKLSNSNAKELIEDASAAGLVINSVSSVNVSKKF